MKKMQFIRHSLLALAVMSAPMAFTACSDNDMAKENLLVVNNSEDEVSINRLGGQIEVPVESNGNWTVVMDDKECDWAQTWTEGGESGGSLTLDVDYFDPRNQQQERKTAFTITNGTVSRHVTLRQYIGLNDGETADNASTQPYPDLWNSKGVGRGLNALNGNATDFVLNPKKMIKAGEEDDYYSTLFTQTTYPHSINDFVLTDTLEDNYRGLGVHCSIDIKYAKFKLNVTVDYMNSGKQVEHAKQYNASQNLAFLEARASVADVAALLEEDLDPTSFKWNANGMGVKMVSVGFKHSYSNVVKAFWKRDTTNFKTAVNAMLDKYGQVIIDGATLGGSVFTSVEYDSVMVADNIKLDSAKVTAGIQLGAIQIGGSVNVNYQQLGQTIWQESHHYCEASGGGKDALVALVGMMNENFVNRDSLKVAAQKWLDSIISSNDDRDNTALIKCRYTPIWNIFPYDVAQAIKPLVVARYKGEKFITIKPEDMGFTKDELK